MIELRYDRATKIFYPDPPDRATLLLIKKACVEFAKAETEDEAFAVMARWSQRGVRYAEDEAPDVDKHIISASAVSDAVETHEVHLEGDHTAQPLLNLHA